MTDKIDTPSNDYLNRVDDWALCRDVISGSKAVKAAGEKYLPKVGSTQTAASYASYKKRAFFYAATARTVSGYIGLIFRKDPAVILPPALQELVKTVTPQGHTLDDLLEEVVTEVVEVNYVGLLVDHPAINPDITTLAQARRSGVRPYISIYKAETIIGVEYAIVNGVRAISRVRLQEDAKTIRELTLINGIYNIIIWSKPTVSSGEFMPGEPSVPLANGQPLGFIPFLLCSDEAVFSAPPLPLLNDLAEANISHYQTSADLDEGAHKTALPTPWVTGEFEDNAAPAGLEIGGGMAWVLNGKSAQVGMLEYAGTGLAHLEKRADAKAAMMVTLGARILASEKASTESSETHSIKRAGENSVLASLARTVSRQITQALVWLSAWAGIAGDISVELNVDFVPGEMTPQALTAWVSALQTGAISQQTFFEALQSGEAISPAISFEDEQDRRAATQADTPPTGI